MMKPSCSMKNDLSSHVYRLVYIGHTQQKLCAACDLFFSGPTFLIQPTNCPWTPTKCPSSSKTRIWAFYHWQDSTLKNWHLSQKFCDKTHVQLKATLSNLPTVLSCGCHGIVTCRCHPVDWENPEHALAKKEPRKGKRLSLAADIHTPDGTLVCYCAHLEVGLSLQVEA